MKVVFITLALLLPQLSFACPLLAGKWQSSLEQFKQFNQRWANIDARPLSFMLQTQGKETIEYASDKQIKITGRAHQITMGERTLNIPSFAEESAYQSLGCTENSIAIKTKVADKWQISLLNFVTEDMYWVYMGDPESDGNSHIREFYIRAL